MDENENEGVYKLFFWLRWSELKQFIFYSSLITILLFGLTTLIYIMVDPDTVRPKIEQIEFLISLYFNLLTGR